MPEVMKVQATLPLREDPRNDSSQVMLDGLPLRVFAGEKVNSGAKASVTEQVNAVKINWTFVEATTGADVDKRKGFVDGSFLVAEATDVPIVITTSPFSRQIDKEDFANTCNSQAALNETNPAYLYALAFALSGDQWTATDVKTNDPPTAPAIGVFRFPKDTWQLLISLAEATGILPEQIEFPEVQCIVAAILSTKSANSLKGKITGRGLSAVDLFLAHLFADDGSFGSAAADLILKAEKADKTKSVDSVVEPVYPVAPVRTAILQRNANIFGANGSDTVERLLASCVTRMDAGFAEVRKMANEADSDVFGASIPSNSTDPIPDGGGADGGPGHVTITVPGAANGIDRRQFLGELKDPAIVRKMADMVKGEVGPSAPHDTKVVQLETAFNRAMARGHSLRQALLSTSEDRVRGYYQGGPNGTFSRPVTAAEFEDFIKNILPEILGGSNRSEQLLGFVATGNASPPTSTAQFARGTRGADLPTAVPGHPESYFAEGPFRVEFKRLPVGQSISLSIGPSASGPAGLSDQGEPPERMDGDTEGNGPVGGKFNAKAGTPIAPESDRQTITLSNGATVTINKSVAAQFRGFFNDLIKNGAPVRGLGGFGTRNNPSEHPLGLAIDWAQHSRNVVDADVQQWISNHRELLRKLERRWGMSGGENWHNPDTGHFSIERILGAAHLQASSQASAND